MDVGTARALLSSAFLGTAVVHANVGLRYLHPARGALVSIPSTTLVYWLLALSCSAEKGGTGRRSRSSLSSAWSFRRW